MYIAKTGTTNDSYAMRNRNDTNSIKHKHY